MKRTQLLALVVCCIVLGVACLLAARHNAANWGAAPAGAAKKEKLFSNFPINEIRSVRITGPKGSVEVKRGKERWEVASKFSYPANYADLATILRQLNGLEIIQNVTVGEADYARLKLLRPGAKAKEEETGLVVEFADANGKKLLELVFGKEHMAKAASPNPYFGNFPNGRFLLVPDQKRVVLVQETFYQLRAEADGWLDKTFLKEDGKLKSAEAKKGDQVQWSVSRENADKDLVLAGDVPATMDVDKAKVDELDRVLSFPSFSDIGDPAKKDADWGFAEGVTFKAEYLDGFTYTFKLGKKGTEGYYPARVSIEYKAPPAPEGKADEKPEDKDKRLTEHQKKISDARDKAQKETDRCKDWVFMLASYTVDSMVREPKDFLKEKPKPEPKKDEGAKKDQPPVAPTEVEELKPGAPDTVPPPAPPEVKAPEARPAEVKAPEAKPAEAKAPEAKPAEAKVPEAKPEIKPEAK